MQGSPYVLGGEFAEALGKTVWLMIPCLWEECAGCPGLKQALCICSIGSWYPTSPHVVMGSWDCREGLIIPNILHSLDVPRFGVGLYPDKLIEWKHSTPLVTCRKS